jgi:hypothetical protein
MNNAATNNAAAAPTHAECPICGKRSKLTKRGKMSTHGGRKLGWGVQRHCNGSGMAPGLEALEYNWQVAQTLGDYDKRAALSKFRVHVMDLGLADRADAMELPLEACRAVIRCDEMMA